MDRNRRREQPDRAVAVRYDPEREHAPRILASGRGDVAEKILEIARKHGVPAYVDPDLVEILAQFEPGTVVPEELYQVMAEILAFIYRLNRKRQAKAGQQFLPGKAEGISRSGQSPSSRNQVNQLENRLVKEE
jgi:flagellar biosynthesis protein